MNSKLQRTTSKLQSLLNKTSKLVVDHDKIKEMKLDEKFTRIDGKKLTQKQKEKIYHKTKEETKEEGYNPRKCRLKHGIKDYDERMKKRKV